MIFLNSNQAGSIVSHWTGKFVRIGHTCACLAWKGLYEVEMLQCIFYTFLLLKVYYFLSSYLQTTILKSSRPCGESKRQTQKEVKIYYRFFAKHCGFRIQWLHLALNLRWFSLQQWNFIYWESLAYFKSVQVYGGLIWDHKPWDLKSQARDLNRDFELQSSAIFAGSGIQKLLWLLNCGLGTKMR